MALGEIHSYLANADFRYTNRRLLKNANRANILVVTGVLLAKNLVVEIETDFDLSVELVLKLNQVTDGKLDFSKNKR